MSNRVSPLPSSLSRRGHGRTVAGKTLRITAVPPCDGVSLSSQLPALGGYSEPTVSAISPVELIVDDDADGTTTVRGADISIQPRPESRFVDPQERRLLPVVHIWVLAKHGRASYSAQSRQRRRLRRVRRSRADHRARRPRGREQQRCGRLDIPRCRSRSRGAQPRRGQPRLGFIGGRESGPDWSWSSSRFLPE